MQEVIEQQNAMNQPEHMDECEDDGETDQESDEYADEGEDLEEENEEDFSEGSFCIEEGEETINPNDPRWQNVTDQPQPAQSQKQLNDAQTKLGSNVTDMLINLYNGKPTADYQEHYATIA